MKELAGALFEVEQRVDCHGLPPSQVGQHVAVGMATERSATTRLKELTCDRFLMTALNVPMFATQSGGS